MESAETTVTRRPTRPRTVFVNQFGAPLDMSSVDKFHRDILVNHLGQEPAEIVTQTPKTKRDVKKSVLKTTIDTDNPLAGLILKPGDTSPICGKCGLDGCGSKNPYMEFHGTTTPLITVVMEGVKPPEDEAGFLTGGTPSLTLAQHIRKNTERTGVMLKDIRWVCVTRCSNRDASKMINYKTKGNWCRHFLIQDLLLHPPKLVIPVGTATLGLLSHKSNAETWGGKLLTYRGWPDDWLCEKKYVLPRTDPADPSKTIIGHPLFGAPPVTRIPMWPIQSPQIIRAAKSDKVRDRWLDHIFDGLSLIKDGVPKREYVKHWYEISEDPGRVAEVLREIISQPGMEVTYDTETTGVKQWAPGAAIVFIMFRWTDPKTNRPRSIGFPWNFKTSALLPHLEMLTPLVLEALYVSKLIGHNLIFDILFTYTTLKGADLNRLSEAGQFDTWHMAYTYRQERGSLGLEVLAYKWVPELSGYEEEMTLLIELHGEELNPASGKGGHYANCPREKWDTHLKPYVMGDVEVCRTAKKQIMEKLKTAPLYDIPLANPWNPGHFRVMEAPGRAWVYRSVMSPAMRTLGKMMGRGLFVDAKELDRQEKFFPRKIKEERDNFKGIPQLASWLEQQEANPEFELDLENKAQLKDILFTQLGMPVQRLTKQGKREHGDTDEAILGLPREKQIEYAATDKFTLNKLAVDFPEIRPLQDYRKVYKLYSTFVRPLRNIKTEGIDKKARTKDPHLCLDSCIHASFMLTGTRTGRLSSRDPNLQQLPSDAIIKRMFVSRFGERGCVYGADLSQIELRLMAMACGDPAMMKAYNEELDIHSLTASRIFNIEYEMFEKSYMKKLQEQGKNKEAKDLDLKRKVAKCVHPDTLVSVAGKITRVGELHTGREPDTFYPMTGSIQGPDGQVPLRHFYSNGINKTLLICSRRGLLACSEEHPLRLKNGSLKKAKDIRVGDEMADPIPLACGSENPKILFNPLSERLPKTGHFSVNVDENLAYVLGLFYGDGCSNYGEVSISTGGRPDFFEWQDTIADAARRCGFDPAITRTTYDSRKSGPKVIKCGPSRGQEIHGSSGIVSIGSTRVSDLFVQLGAVNDNTSRQRSLRIPEWLFNASYSVKQSFLAGWIDTDGSNTKCGSLNGVTKSWVLAQDLMVLMDTMGVRYGFEPSWNKAYKRFYFRINISVIDSWHHFHAVLRNPVKRNKVHAPRYGRISKPNLVNHVIKLDAGPLVDVEVGTPEHLFLTNSFTSRNTTNFLTGYGGGAFGLQTTLANAKVYMPIEECESIIKKFFDSYPMLRTLLGLYKDFIRVNGVAVSIFGRVRLFEEVYGNDDEAASKAYRAGCNHLIQATASDLMLVCLCVIENVMRQSNLESILVLTVHDSLLIDAVWDEIPAVHEIVDGVLNHIPEVLELVFGKDYDMSWLTVPLAGDCEIGKNYLDVVKLPRGNNVDWDAVKPQIEKAAEHNE